MTKLVCNLLYCFVFLICFFFSSIKHDHQHHSPLSRNGSRTRCTIQCGGMLVTILQKAKRGEKRQRQKSVSGWSRDGPVLGETEAPWQQDWQLNTVADRLISHGRKKKKNIKKSKRKFHTPLRVKEKTTSLTQRLVVFHHFSKVYFHSQTICFFQLKAFNIWSFSQKQYRYG